jgi:hypothetical protein
VSGSAPLLDAYDLRAVAHVRAARIRVEYPPAEDPLARRRLRGWRAPVARLVTVSFDAALPAAATVPAAAADLLYMRGCRADGTALPDLPPAAWRAAWWYQQPADAAPRLELHVQRDGPDFGYVIDFAPLERWGLALERAERERRLRVDLHWEPTDGLPAITIALTFEPGDLPADGLREFARDWRRQAIHADRLSIPKPPDARV